MPRRARHVVPGVLRPALAFALPFGGEPRLVALRGLAGAALLVVDGRRGPLPGPRAGERAGTVRGGAPDHLRGCVPKPGQETRLEAGRRGGASSRRTSKRGDLLTVGIGEARSCLDRLVVEPRR